MHDANSCILQQRVKVWDSLKAYSPVLCLYSPQYFIYSAFYPVSSVSTSALYLLSTISSQYCVYFGIEPTQYCIYSVLYLLSIVSTSALYLFSTLSTQYCVHTSTLFTQYCVQLSTGSTEYGDHFRTEETLVHMTIACAGLSLPPHPFSLSKSL